MRPTYVDITPRGELAEEILLASLQGNWPLPNPGNSLAVAACDQAELFFAELKRRGWIEESEQP